MTSAPQPLPNIDPGGAPCSICGKGCGDGPMFWRGGDVCRACVRSGAHLKSGKDMRGPGTRIPTPCSKCNRIIKKGAISRDLRAKAGAQTVQGTVCETCYAEWHECSSKIVFTTLSEFLHGDAEAPAT